MLWVSVYLIIFQTSNMNETIDMFCPLEGSVLDISHEEEVTLSEATINSELCPVTSTPHKDTVTTGTLAPTTDVVPKTTVAHSGFRLQLQNDGSFKYEEAPTSHTGESYDVWTNIDNCIPRINVLKGYIYYGLFVITKTFLRTCYSLKILNGWLLIDCFLISHVHRYWRKIYMYVSTAKNDEACIV